MALRIFVYGTLKRGGEFHDRYCAGFVSVAEASVEGRVSHLPAGYPVLDVETASILAVGTADPVADVATAERFAAEAAKRPLDPAKLVRGELFTFEDPEGRLPALDRLEGYRPSRKSLYLRALLPVQAEPAAPPVPAWAYIRS